MDDREIVKLYLARDENALAQAKIKYGASCTEIARGILHSKEDAEEIVSDVLMQSWNSIPPAEPAMLGAFLFKCTRNLALNRARDEKRKKRGGGSSAVLLSELEDHLPSSFDTDDELCAKELSRILNRFLSEQNDEARRIFVLRCYFQMKEKDVAKKLGVSLGKVKMSLLASRKKLRDKLKKEGYYE